MRYTAIIWGLLSLAVLKAEGITLPAKTAKGRLRQTALLLGIPSWTARISPQRAFDSPGLKSPFFPIIPTLERDPAYATSPLFRSSIRSHEEDVSYSPNTLPDISILRSLRRKRNTYKEMILKKILVIALVAGIGLAPIFASPQRAQAQDMSMLQRTAPEVSVVAKNRVTFRLDEQEGTFLEQNVLNRMLKSNNKNQPSHASSRVVDQTNLVVAQSSSSEQHQQPIEHQARGGHNGASTTIITNEVVKQVQVSILFLSLKIVVLGVLVVAAATGGLEDMTMSLRKRLEEEWPKLSYSKTIDFDAIFRSFVKDKSNNRKFQKSPHFLPADPVRAWKLKQVQMRIQRWEHQNRHDKQKFMLQKSSHRTKTVLRDIMLKRSEPHDQVDARSSPLFSTAPQTTANKVDPPPQHQQSSPWDIPSWTSELQSKYSKKYVALQRNPDPDSPVLLTYRIDDRPNKPKQPTVSIGLKRSNTTGTTIY